MSLRSEEEQHQAAPVRADAVQLELDHRMFHLKTLYDVSRDIFSTIDFEKIVRSFLLMTMGNFGVMEGFVLVMETSPRKIRSLIWVGMSEMDVESLRRFAMCTSCGGGAPSSGKEEPIRMHPDFLPAGIQCTIPFSVEPQCAGLLGLGSRLLDRGFDERDQELLATLVNNLVIALRHSRSFEEVERLNAFLEAQNARLEESNARLSTALRKVEVLESIKNSLSKFVPMTVSRLIERSPEALNMDNREQDISVLFLDIEGYTRICERHSPLEVNGMVEQCFSGIMEAVCAHDGDINETAGDGLMVLFFNEDRRTNALQAVRTAVAVQEGLRIDQARQDAPAERLVVNAGINSGPALVGASKFHSYTGSRWSYTARGMTVNIAARLGAMATGGSILLSASTAERVGRDFRLASLGKFRLKNVSEEVDVFSL